MLIMMGYARLGEPTATPCTAPSPASPRRHPIYTISNPKHHRTTRGLAGRTEHVKARQIEMRNEQAGRRQASEIDGRVVDFLGGLLACSRRSWYCKGSSPALRLVEFPPHNLGLSSATTSLALSPPFVFLPFLLAIFLLHLPAPFTVAHCQSLFQPTQLFLIDTSVAFSPVPYIA